MGRILGERGVIQAIAAIMMLAIIGSAAAMWSDSLKVAITIKTGDVDVEFGTISVDDTGIDPGYDKDVAKCYADLMEIQNEDNGNPTGNNDLDLNITIVNGYPSYSCNVTFTVINTGTIPVKGPHVTTLSSNLSSAVTCTNNFTPERQIEPGQSETFWIKCHVEQSAAENSTYVLELKLMFHQWNEEPS
jgi:hypothetical protein